jgi:hypothetical protein
MNKRQKNDMPIILYAFIGAGIGAFLGLLAYVKDWI